MTIKKLSIPMLGQPDPNTPSDVHLVGRYALGVTWADQHGSIRCSAEREPLVPRLVDRLLGTGLGYAAAQPLASLLPRVRPCDALRAVRVTRELTELLQLGDRALRIDAHGTTLTGCFECGMLCA